MVSPVSNAGGSYPSQNSSAYTQFKEDVQKFLKNPDSDNLSALENCANNLKPPSPAAQKIVQQCQNLATAEANVAQINTEMDHSTNPMQRASLEVQLAQANQQIEMDQQEIAGAVNQLP